MAVVTGAGVYALSQPRSVQYHRRAYIEECCGRAGTMLWRDTLESISPDYSAARHLERIERHESVLLNAGFLEERTFVISNRPPYGAMDSMISGWFGRFRTEPMGLAPLSEGGFLLLAKGHVIARTRTQGSNAVVVVGAKDGMQKWEELAREVDVAEPRK
jgi:hypothetical protein